MMQSEVAGTKRIPEGNVEGFSGGVLRGWVWFPGEPASEAVVEFLVDESVVATFIASEFRMDLQVAGKRDGACGFAVSFHDRSLQGKAMVVRVCGPDGTSLELPGSPLPMEIASEAAAVTLLPVALNGLNVAGYLDTCGLGKVRGWVARTDDRPEPVVLAFHEGGKRIFTTSAHKWRNDLAEVRQGNGSCGFDADIPAEYTDGTMREWDVRDGETGQTLLSRPLRMVMEPALARALGKTSASPRVAPIERTTESSLRLSIVVNFYNMQREAARTLTSLSRAYQQGIGDLEYEVICVDNGSDPPLDKAWIESFGPEFRLLRPEAIQASPCPAINRAVREARGEYVAIMIDGAHVLTPGVFREAMDAVAIEPQAVVAIRHWFVGGDQRWLSEVGYTREQEDKLFARIHWPSDGYQLFHIGAPIGEHAEPWLVGMIESNCLFLPTALYCEIGGMDEAFSEPGAGFANLDLFQRAGLAAPEGMVSVVGEATFHQFHGGTTTNVSDDVKDVRVRAYARNYTALRGEDFEGIGAERIRLRGVIRDKSAIGIRQRSLLPMKLGITSRIRPGMLEQHFDEEARLYLQSAYAESGLHETTRWLGHAVALAPADLLNLQEIIHAQRPDHIITNSPAPGLHAFLDSVLVSQGLQHARVSCVVGPEQDAPAGSPRLRTIVSDGDPDRLAEALAGQVAGSESVMVLLSPNSGEVAQLVSEIQSYSRYVSYRSYLVVLGTVFGQPWLGYSSNWYLAAIRRFVASSPFAMDASMDRHWVTTSPCGYLRRVGGRISAADYDPSLDDLGIL